MTPEQKTLVQVSYLRLVPMADTAAQLFYTRLFHLDPSLRVLFKADFQDQSMKFMDMVRIVVAELDRPDKIDRTLRELGVRHIGYGVLDGHYDTVGEALLWALDKSLGRDAGQQVLEAWSEFYNLVVSIMQEGARTHANQ